MPHARSSTPTKLVALFTLAGATNLVAGCGDETAYRAASTARMAERLEVIAQMAVRNNSEYANSARAEALRLENPEPDLRSQLTHRAHLGEQLLYAGRSDEAIPVFEGILATVAEHRGEVPRPYVDRNREFLGISYLRLGAQENGVLDRTGGSFLLPMSPDARHMNERGARAAIAVYEAILRDDPSKMLSRWLLNLAYMTVGEHPDRVPEQWLIPVEAFESEYDIHRFPDVAPALGLDVVGHGGGSIMEDFDGDGYLDILASSRSLRDQIRYFRNNGDGSFTDRTVESGLQGLVSGIQIVQTDYDNDGFRDVLVLRGAWLLPGRPNSLLRNNGDGTFDDVTEAAGLLDEFPTQAAAWGDYDNDGWLDLFIGNETPPRTRPNPSQLFHNNGDGTFTDVADDAGVAVVGIVKGVAWGDIDNDGQLDLYVSRMGQPNLLFHNDGDAAGRPRFSEVGGAAGVREPMVSFPTWFFDYNNDGWQDIFVSGYKTAPGDIAREYLGLPHGSELPRPYRNNGDGTFTDATKAAHVDKIMNMMGSNFGDLDNDGYQDFYAGTGTPDLRSLMPNRVFRNAGGEYFQEVTPSGGFGRLDKGHAVAFGDVDNDGDQDIYVVMGGAYEGDISQNAFFANPGHGNAWITLRLEGVATNRAAMGARIRVTVDRDAGSRDIYVTVTTGGSFGASSLQQEIGLGDATAIRQIAITWPTTGQTDVYQDVGMNQILHIREGAPAPVPVTLNTFDIAAPASTADPADPGGRARR